MAVCRSSNLQGIISSVNLPRQIGSLLDSFHQVADEDHRGTRLADETHHPPTKPPRPITLAQDIRAAVAKFLNRKYRTNQYTVVQGRWTVPPTALALEKVSIRGIIYASEKALPRDSNVIFRRVGGSSHRAGRIASMFSLSYPAPDTGSPVSTNTFLVVREWEVVEDEDAQRRYRQFGFAGGFLCRNRTADVHLVGVDNIVSHHAKTFFDQRESERFHVLPLNKVREFVSFRCHI